MSLQACETGLFSRLIGTRFGGIGRFLLRYEVESVVLVGVFFAILCVLSIIRSAEVPNWNRKLFWGILGLCCFCGTLTFYGWGSMGDPRAVWGLCDPDADEPKEKTSRQPSDNRSQRHAHDDA